MLDLEKSFEHQCCYICRDRADNVVEIAKRKAMMDSEKLAKAAGESITAALSVLPDIPGERGGQHTQSQSPPAHL